jgi:putative proteasome-type protease
VVRPETSLQEGRKVVLLSMDATMRSNLSVGMPLDLAVIRRDECRISERERIEPGDATFAAISDAWSRALRDAFANMPG